MELPGFVDLQVNGYKGIDFSSARLTEEQFAKACRQLLAHGTAAFLPTIITSPDNVYEKNLKIMADVISSSEFNNKLLGIHAEGPFISSEPGAIGAHNPDLVKNPSIQYLEKINKWANGKLKVLTIAAELPNALELIDAATQMGITVFLGHQVADEKQLRQAAQAGAKALTHLGNGMPNLVDRHNNSLLYGLAVDELAAIIITDGHHLPPHVIKTIIRVKGLDKIVVISDASPLAGMPPGRYETLGNPVVLEESGLLYNPETGYMVGSSVTMLECMNYLAKTEFLKEDDLVKVGFYNPCQLINDANLVHAVSLITYNSNEKVFKLKP
jgi:N-acetylglucosamine-6-phosphate deacetylase